MRMRKTLSILVVVMLLSALFVTPAAAVESSGVAAPKADFQSIWDHVQGMIVSIDPEHEVMDSPVTVSEQDGNEATVEEKEEPVNESAGEAKAAPIEVKPTPAPVQDKPAPAPVQEKPAPAPVEAKPVPAPVEVKPTPAPASDYAISDFEKEVVRLVNIERQKAGLKPLVMDTLLSKGARAKSQDMVDNNYFSHTSPKYGSPFAMMKAFGVKYSTAGENIASGQRTPASVVRAWMNSPGHRANILSSKYGKIGVGYAYKSSGNYNHYWTQWFTN